MECPRIRKRRSEIKWRRVPEATTFLALSRSGFHEELASTTCRLNSAVQGISRFTACVLQSGVDMPYRAIKTNIADSLNIIVQIARRPGARFVSEMLEICGYDPE